MINIILCDDDKFILQLSKERIKEEISNNQFDARISCISTESKEVVQYLTNNTGDYLVFLDLDFGNGNLNGIDVAKQLKSINKAAKIVFVTNHYEMAMKVLASGVEPFGFIEKSTDMQALSNGYKRYIQMAISLFKPKEENEAVIELAVGIDEFVSVDKSQILYLESEKSISHGITYHTMHGSCITVRDTIEHCMERLGEEFVRVHRSLLVNRRYIVSLNGTTLRLANGEDISCAVRMIGEVKKWLKR